MTILIPAYQPDEKLITLVSELRQIYSKHIVIVDDGSGNSYRGIFDNLEESATVLHYEPNIGKGHAIKHGLYYIREHLQESEGVVTADADGQHTPVDIHHLCNILKEGSADIILGARDFQGRIPWKSRLGNAIMSRIYHIVCGVNLRDTQTGLRGLSVELMDWLLAVPGERFEYEMSVLLGAARKGISLLEVPIQTIYHDSNSETHFQPVADSIRLLRTIQAERKASRRRS